MQNLFAKTLASFLHTEKHVPESDSKLPRARNINEWVQAAVEVSEPNGDLDHRLGCSWQASWIKLEHGDEQRRKEGSPTDEERTAHKAKMQSNSFLRLETGHHQCRLRLCVGVRLFGSMPIVAAVVNPESIPILTHAAIVVTITIAVAAFDCSFAQRLFVVPHDPVHTPVDSDDYRPWQEEGADENGDDVPRMQVCDAHVRLAPPCGPDPQRWRTQIGRAHV